MEDDSVLLTGREVAAKLRIDVGTLAKWRWTKLVNLPYVRVGRYIRYKAADLNAFIDARTQGGPAPAIETTPPTPRRARRTLRRRMP